MIGRSNTLSIRTPEGVEFSLVLAGPVSRFLAWALDQAVISVASSTVGAVVGLLGLVSADLARAGTVLLYFLISMGYPIVMEYRFRGQTLGKRLFRLQVMDEQGLPLTFSQVVIRNLMRFVDTLPAAYLVGGVSCFVSRRSQRLGDIAAGTIVTRNPRIRPPDLDRILTDKFNSFDPYPHLKARLRQRVSAREAGLALQALLRRDQFDPDARIQLFRDMADHFRDKLTFPQEAIDGLSDEQYVRNVAATMFRRDRA